MATTPRTLAQHLAHIARQLKEAINTALATEYPNGPWYRQLEACRQTLLPTLTPAEFADMYAQTIVYSLFASRVLLHDATSTAKTPSTSREQNVAPFAACRFNRVDTRIASLIDECTTLLKHTDIDEILRDFGKATMQHDPVFHFYETFLAAYDPKTRNMRGVYYTPEPVVSYIVRSVDHILQTCFDKPMGLADETTIILDPATGTATFLHAVVQHIYTTLTTLDMAESWTTYVPEQLLPRLVGFEVLMAPYTIAHLKLSMLLHTLGYTLGSTEQLGIYLTNALANNTNIEPLRHQACQEHQDSSQCCSVPAKNCLFPSTISGNGSGNGSMKKEVTMVILGNPPYSYESANTGEWISALVRDYYHVDGQPLGERNPRGLQDDYVKFIRFGQWRINQTGEGILAFISNNGYLENPTFRGMRQSLLHEFDIIYILNLHGNSRKKERTPDGSPDENVFDIQQGTAIGIFVKKEGTMHTDATIYYADLWGKRDSKYATLAAQDVHHTAWQTITPTTPWYLFVPQDTKVRDEYEQGWKITAIMPISCVGIVTARDHLTIQWSRNDMLRIAQHFASLPPEEARQHYRLGADVRDWKVKLAQTDIQRHGNNAPSYVVPIVYRPFDNRYTYYTGQTRGFHSMPRSDVMQHMLAGPNIAFIGMRQYAYDVVDYCYVWVGEHIAEIRIFISNRGGASIYPLYLYANDNEHLDMFDCPPSTSAGNPNSNLRHPNLAPDFIADVEQRLGLAFIPDGVGNLRTTIGPEDIFHYMYAILYSPSYRACYDELLKIDFPHIPITNDKGVLTVLVAHGATLVDLHLLRLPGSSSVGGAGGAAILDNPGEQGITQQCVTTRPIEHIRYDKQHAHVYIAKDAFFAGIAPETWAMQIGGYQPLHKWLKDRKGRTLSFDDALHYMRMVIALRETRRIMAEIDTIMRF